MNSLRNLLGAGLLVGAGAMSAGASAVTVSVTFVQPETFELAALQKDLQQHLELLADRKLAASDSLQVEVLDIDLAGDFQPLRWASFSDVRVVRDIASPRMTLRYTAKLGDRVVTGPEEQLSNMNFLSSHNHYSSGDRLRYEKPMLDTWFAKQFGKP